MAEERTPTLADAAAVREAAEHRYAEARGWMAAGRWKAALAAVESAVEREQEADRLELLARRAMMDGGVETQ